MEKSKKLSVENCDGNSSLYFYFISIQNKRLVPIDGFKGKTWGPSTLHQRERGHIIAKTSSEDWLQTHSSQDFSKSAPNLDKNRQQQFKQLFYSRDVLSHNSDEGIIQKNSTLTTKNTTTPTSPNSQFKIEIDPKSSRIYLITDTLNINCNSNNNVNNRNVNLSANHKKHSLDSSEYDQRNSQSSQSSDKTLKNNNSVVLYDRIFYRKVQQKIFSSTDYLDSPESSMIQPEAKQASKSSGDLTITDHYNDHFQRKGSQFSRECFFTSNHRNNFEDEDVQDDQVDDFNVSLDKMNSVNSSFDEQSNSICSDASSVSRKSSTVTFRHEHDVINSSSISRDTDDVNFSINRSLERLYKGQVTPPDKPSKKPVSKFSNLKKIFSKKKISSSSSTLSTNSLVYTEFRNIHDSSENVNNTSRSRKNYKKI